MSTIILPTNDFYKLSRLMIDACVPPKHRRKYKATVKLINDALNAGNELPDIPLAGVITDVKRIAKASDIQDVLNYVLEFGEKEKSEGEYLKICGNMKALHQFHSWFSRCTHIVGTVYFNQFIIISFDESIEKIACCLNEAKHRILNEEPTQSPPS